MSAPRALEGIRVLDLSRILAAPLAAQMLGDLGADVIKIERPGVGDDSRAYGPPFLETPGDDPDPAAFYLSCNRNKRSVTLDHSKPEGQKLLRRLVAESDVLIENFRPGVLAKYGLDYAPLAAVNPGLVYCSITGFGQDGPYAGRPGYDGVFQAMSGMMSVSGLPDGVPGAGPMKVGVSMIDILTGLYAGNAILAALHHRDAADGVGQHIDLSLLDCGLAALSHYAQSYLVSGQVPERRGNGGYGGIPSQSFRCSDHDIFLVAATDQQFAALCHALHRPDLPTDPRFATVPARISHRRELLAILDALFLTRPAAAWIADLEAADVPVSPVNTLPDALANPQLAHRAMRVRTDDGLDLLRNPIRFSATPIESYAAPPALGGDTADVLQALGLSPAEIAALHADKVI
ncbi:CoA transferase [Streptomyces sp. NBC_01537]|uniref:CaiB/BaiF CoA transferase family protein n=1 Tax=Streptomyces sp. NBC_01537 TaxID=2903896 RepID=UPI003863C20F